MTNDQVKHALIEYHFTGKWPIAQLAKNAGLAPDTIRRAFNGDISVKTQTRLEQLFKILPEKYIVPQPKRKPGHKKRYMILYLNLKHWISILEAHHGRLARFQSQRYHSTRLINSGYVCCKLDYIGKRYLLEVFGSELQKKRISLGDCYPFAQWVLRIKATLPGFKKELVARLISRRR